MNRDNYDDKNLEIDDGVSDRGTTKRMPQYVTMSGNESCKAKVMPIPSSFCSTILPRGILQAASPSYGMWNVTSVHRSKSLLIGMT